MWHLLLSPACMATLLLGLQLASSSPASGSGPGGLVPAVCPGLLLAEGDMGDDGCSHTPSMALRALRPPNCRAMAPPAQRGGRGTVTNSSAFGPLAPRDGEAEGGPVVSVMEEDMRLQKKNRIVLDGHCFWKDPAWGFSHHSCRHLTPHADSLYCSLILPLCKAMSILVTTITGIQLLVRRWKSYQGQRESRERWAESPHGVVWGAAACPECAICLQAWQPGWPLKLLSCSHVYHGRCIDRWHRAQPGSKTCPLCLRGVTMVVLVHPPAHSSQQE